MSTNLEAHPAPFGVDIEPSPNGLRIWCWWFSPWALGDAVAAVFIGGVLVQMGRPFQHMLTTEHLAILGAVAGVVAYFCLARIVNRTYVEISDQQVRVAHGPLPWRLGITLSTRDVSTLDVGRATHYLRGIGKVTRHSLHAILNNGGHATLLAEMYQRDRVLAVKHAIEEHLDLPDRVGL